MVILSNLLQHCLVVMTDWWCPCCAKCLKRIKLVLKMNRVKAVVQVKNFQSVSAPKRKKQGRKTIGIYLSKTIKSGLSFTDKVQSDPAREKPLQFYLILKTGT